MKANSSSQCPAAAEGHPVIRRRHLSLAIDSVGLPNTAASAFGSHDPLPYELRRHRVMSSSCGDDEGHATQETCPSYSSCSDCAEVLHELSNVMTGVLTNAQMLGWKLPPYSHLKRPVREVERNAQRGGELLKRLINRCAEKALALEVEP
jgi:hypothetical protein